MRVLVTGGTGFIGRPLCAHLVEHGHTPVVWSRRPTQARELLAAGSEVVADLDEAKDIAAAINLAGENLGSGRWNAARKQRFIDSRVDTTRALVEWMEGAGVGHLVSASGIGFYGICGDEEVSEDSQSSGLFQGGLDLCAAWEGEARRAERFGARIALVRTGLVLHPEGGGLQQMLLPYRLGLGGPIGSGRQWWSWIHRYDLVRLYTFLLEHPTASGEFNGVAPDPQRQRDFARCLGSVLKRPAFMPGPAFMFRLMFGEMAELLTTGQRVVPRRTLAAGFEFHFPELEGALRDLLR